VERSARKECLPSEIEYWVKCMPRRLDDKDYYSLVAEIDLMLEPILIKDALRISAGLP
jgi:hypothetical protein